MISLFKTVLLMSFFLNGQAVLATPQSDASLIVERSQNLVWKETLRQTLKKSFVTVYFRPISGRGISIADQDRFIELVPDEDIAPYLDRLRSRAVEYYLSVYTTEQLAAIAIVLRADEDATMEEILSDAYNQRFALALEQARASAQSSGSDDPLVIGLEELIVQLNALSATLEGDGAEAIAQDFAQAIGHLFALMGYADEITRIEVEPTNPVTVAAIKTDGVLRFANPVQRQTLLRQLSGSETTGGVRFIKPPADGTEPN